jgi:hypothetical protein
MAQKGGDGGEAKWMRWKLSLSLSLGPRKRRRWTRRSDHPRRLELHRHFLSRTTRQENIFFDTRDIDREEITFVAAI